MSYETEIPCPECGERELEVSVSKAIGEGLLNILVTGEKFLKMIKDGELDSELQEAVQSIQCKNCNNKESKLDETLVKRGFDKERD